MANLKIELLAETEKVRGSSVPVGLIATIPKHMNVPSGWLLCNGLEIAKDNLEYEKLFNIIGTVYGETNGFDSAGTSHFRLPNLMQNYYQTVPATYNNSSTLSTIISDNYHSHNVTANTFQFAGFASHNHVGNIGKGGYNTNAGNHGGNHASNFGVGMSGPTSVATRANGNLGGISPGGHTHSGSTGSLNTSDVAVEAHSHGSGNINSVGGSFPVGEHNHSVNATTGSVVSHSSAEQLMLPSIMVKYIIKY